MGKLQVLIAEDSALLAAELRELIGSLPGFSIVGIVPSTADVRDLLRRRPVDVLILDVLLQDGSSLSLLEEGVATRCRTILMTAQPSESLRTRVLRLGAVSLLDKAEGFDALLSWLHGLAPAP
ncbi:MAG: response regulator [Bryobacteraceae bacterium]|nr:response regulator [Bryobacteraceae bacterium]